MSPSYLKKSILTICLSLALIQVSTPVSQAADIPAGERGFKSHVAKFFKTYCVDCHGPEKSKGKITVHSLSGDMSKGQDIEHWESILDMLDFGEMPPIDEKQPSKQEVQAIMLWIESGMRDYVAKARQEVTAPKTRRLTNIEYQNTLNELLGFELDIMKELSEDPELHYGFNNTAHYMRMVPEQLDRYLEIARRAMRAAIVDPGQPKVYRQRRTWAPNGIDKGMGSDEIGVWGNRRGTAAEGMGMKGFPKHGSYRIRIKAAAILPPGYDEVPLKIDMGTNPGRTETPYKTVGKIYLKNSPDQFKTFEFTGRMENHPYAPVPSRKNGPLVNQMAIKLRVFLDDGTLNDGGYYARNRALEMPRAVVSSIELESPITDHWPPKHHTDILFESPLRKKNEKAYIHEVIKRFISRAYRRPATTPEIEKFLKIHGLIKPSTESLEEAVRETLAMVMISPQFLYHTETDPATDKHYAMASRLSYFLWASMPDQTLLDLAAQRKLDNPKMIKAQVLRMLADERSHDFAEDFTHQWLSIRKMLTVPINRELFPRFLYTVSRGETAGTEVPYGITVRDYMMEETAGFFSELIRRNASALNIVDSDFAYLNERLANHYGIKGVKGMKMRAVPIKPEDNLGGLLTQGSVLIGNGTGTAPHPIYRAVWLREAILGDHVAPPPSEVPALTDTAGESLEKALSIADLLAKHRTVESCNDCHYRLDPWGIPFEHYNAIGQYQPLVPKDGTRVNGFDANKHKTLKGYAKYLASINKVKVDASARVPHGPQINGVRELKKYLIKERKDDIAENMIRRLLTYSVGRKLTYRDRFAVEALFKEAEKNNFKMRDLIVAICQSDVFKDHSNQRKAQ